MRVVVVTGCQPHHKNLCVRLARSHEVVGIIHPAEPSRTPSSTLRKFCREVHEYGPGLFALRLLGKLYGSERGPREPKMRTLRDFTEQEREYLALPKALLHGPCNVRSAETHDLLKSLRPDVTICLGGPIYPKAFIEASPLTLNFHSGISPLYNGNRSIQFAFANGHPHLCGGSLMIMSAGVDSGGLLSHYLPAIEAGDDAVSIFLKTVRGAVPTFERFLNGSARRGIPPLSIAQPRPLFYTKGAEFTWFQKLKSDFNHRKGIPAAYRRVEEFVDYWDTADQAEALARYRTTLNGLLWGRSQP